MAQLVQQVDHSVSTSIPGSCERNLLFGNSRINVRVQIQVDGVKIHENESYGH